MSASCGKIRALFAPYAAEALAGDERRAVREHLAACADCRWNAAAADPAMLFAGPVEIEPVSASDAARILEGVRAGVAMRQAEKRLASGGSGDRARRRAVGRRVAMTAAAAAVALLTLALPSGFSRGPRMTSGAGQAAPGPAARPEGVAATSRPPSGEAEVRPPGATVYEIAPGRGPNEPRVVWIVDGSLDI